MENLFGNTFEQLGASLKAVLDGWSNSFNESINKTMEDFTRKFSEMFAQMMSGFTQEFSDEFSQKLSSSLGEELESILESGLLNDFIFQVELQLEQILSKYLMISSFPIILALIAIIISTFNIFKTKKIALFDKRMEVYIALEFLCNCKSISNTTENQIRLIKLEDQMLTISKSKFIFDENLTKEINDFSYQVYDLIIKNDELVNSNDIQEKTDTFKSNVLPKIEALVKL